MIGGVRLAPRLWGCLNGTGALASAWRRRYIAAMDAWVTELRAHSQTMLEHSRQLREQAEAARRRSVERRIAAQRAAQLAKDMLNFATSHEAKRWRDH